MDFSSLDKWDINERTRNLAEAEFSIRGLFWQVFFFVFSRVEHVHDEEVQLSTRNTRVFFYDVTVQTRRALSVKPANNVCPSADQAMETHSGCLASSRTSV